MMDMITFAVIVKDITYLSHYRSAFCYISGQSLNVGLQVLYASRQSKDYLRDGIYTASEIMNERWNAASWWSLYRINTPDKYYVCDSN